MTKHAWKVCRKTFNGRLVSAITTGRDLIDYESIKWVYPSSEASNDFIFVFTYRHQARAFRRRLAGKYAVLKVAVKNPRARTKFSLGQWRDGEAFHPGTLFVDAVKLIK